jgi:putative ABC transport system permease protein
MVGEESLYSFMFDGEGQWSNSLSYAYVLLSAVEAVATIEPHLADFAQRHMGEYAAGRGFLPDFLLQPLTDIHLHSNLGNEIGVVSDVRYVYLFSAIALLILVIACINFMNLATARAAERAKEVGMRKVLGAHRGQLIRQFFSESVLLTLIALLFAGVMLYLLLPVFNQISGLSLALDATSARWLMLGLLGVSVFVGLVAGSYPALYLSAFRPVGVLKGTFKSSASGIALRKGLVVFQFAVSMVLIAGTLVILSQLNYLRSKPLGFEKEQIVVLPLRDETMRENYETIKEDLAQHPGVMSLSAAAGTPGNQGLIDRFPVRPASVPEADQRPMYIIGTDYDYLDMLGLNLISGRDFSTDYPTDATAAFIINETAAQELGWEDPVGQEIHLNEGDGKRGTVIGVVEDFHFQSLHLPIEPAVLHIWPNRFRYLNVKIRPDDVAGTLAFLEDRWPTYSPDQPFQYSFLDEDFDRQYQAEVRLSTIFSAFSSLAILIACLGLFGLAAFTTQQRTKEIGVRKVLGASVAGIVALLSKDFLKLVLVAFVVATPVVYLAANRWLDGFAFRIDVGVGTLLLAGLLAFAIALLTVSYQALKAATMTPVKSLRSE